MHSSVKKMVLFGINSSWLLTTGNTIFLLSDRLVRFKFNEFKATHCHKIIIQWYMCAVSLSTLYAGIVLPTDEKPDL